MMRRALGLALLGGLLLLPACAQPTGVLLTLESSHAVPDEVDGLMVRVEGADGAVTNQRLQLTEPFPHSLAIVVDDGTPSVTIDVTALEGNVSVTDTRVTVDLTTGLLRPYELSL